MPLLASGATEVHGEVELIAGFPERAEELFREALAARGGLGREQTLIARLAASLIAQVRVDDARDALALIDAAEPGPQVFVVSAAVALARGDAGSAVEQLARAERQLENTEAVLLQIEAAALGARAHQAAGDPTAAAAAAERAVTLAAAKGTTPTPAWLAPLPSMRTTE